jgi:DNA repair exonuclease SbcCD ATPase subunit
MTQVMNDSQLEFDLGEGEKATDVSFDQPEGDESPAAPEPEAKIFQKPEQDLAPKNELDEISEGVQKRISKLTARMREAERREQAALEYAKGLQNQTQTLQQKLVQTDYSRLSEAKTRLETQQTQLRQIIAKAREENDINTELEAQERLSDLVGEQRQVAGWLQAQQAAAQQQQYQQAQQPVQQVQQPRPQPNPQAEEWAEKNPWFGQDRVMTYAAWGIHQTLVEQEGVDPNSQEYYTELDRRVRSTFPDKFKDQSRQQRSAPAVAPAARSSGINSARRTVRLSPSQVAIAKKLGVPLEEYAKYVKE